MKQQMRRGFTLIELLVVIAIIAILAAILFPVFAQARDKARSISCLSNMKQIGSAIMQYTQDYDEVLPAWPFTAQPGVLDMRTHEFWPGWNYSMWVPAIMPYVKSNDVFACPNGTRSSGFQRGPTGNRMYVHMAYNEYVENSQNGYASLASLSSAPNGIADISLVSESSFPGIYMDWESTPNLAPRRPRTFGLGRLFCANGLAGGGTTCLPRHMDNGVNVVFGDGHAKFIVGGSIRGGSAEPREWPIVNPRKPAAR